MKLNDLTIQRKMMSAIMFTVSVVVLLMCSAYLAFDFFSSRNALKDNVETLSVMIAANSSAALAFDNHVDADEILNSLRANNHIVAACLFDKKGSLFAKYPTNIPHGRLPAKPQASGYRFENGYIAGFQPVFQESERLGTLYIKSDMEAVYSREKQFLIVALILIAGALIIAYIISDILQKFISKPILVLEETARIISEKHNYSVRAKKMGNDELGALTDAFNQMLTQIETQDIEIKKSEEASSKLAAIVESSGDAIISKTTEGIITSWNHSATRMFGYTADEIIGKSILTIIPADRKDEEPQILSRVTGGDRVEQFETQRITKNGSLIDVSLTISPIRDATGKIIGLSKIARDVTERKQEERRKNDFIAMVSHELKTPLTSVYSYVQILLARSKKDGDSFRMNALERTVVQTKKMIAMIQDFLNLARLEEGKIQLNNALFDLNPLIAEVAGDAQFLTSSHTIRVKDCDEVRVYADHDKIGQVLTNLLSNAIKYSPQGGLIVIGCEKEGKKIKIYVEDEGIGINPEDQKKLFTRFYRVKNDKIKTISGFGIGLYLASEILRYHHSKIGIKSEEGVGSTFYFYLDIQ